jgi:hypothetical protein
LSNYTLPTLASGPGHITKADATISVIAYQSIYDGGSHTATGSAVGVEASNPADLSSLLHLSGTTHTDAGDYTSDSWTFDGNGNYNSGTGNVHDVIDKADARITVSPYSLTYDGNAHSAIGSATGVERPTPADLTSLLLLTATSHTDAGDYPGDTWTFAGNRNYKAANGTIDDHISRATPVVTVSFTPATVTYDGNPHPALTTAIGVSNSVLSATDGTTSIAYLQGGNVLAGIPTDASNYTASAHFATSNPNYTDADSTQNASLTINKADSVTTVSVAGGTSFTYDGLTHPATVSVTSVNLNLSPTPQYSCGHLPIDVVDSGCMATYSYTGDNNHKSSYGAVTYLIIPASPVFSGLASPTIIFAASTTTLSGTIKAANLAPPGSVAVTVNGITQNAAINPSTGSFSSTFNTRSFAVSVNGYSITYNYNDTVDKNFNSTSGTGTLNVRYQSAGTMCAGDVGHAIRQPINPDQSSVFKLGSTVPTKFAVCDANGNSIGSTGVITGYGLLATSSSSSITVDESVYSTTPDLAFRWDPTGMQWIFNQSTKNNGTMNKGGVVYYFLINLNDGTSIPFAYALK